jgi:hypothetical protein
VSDAVDIVKLVSELPRRPRGRACIVLTHDYAGQAEWAAQLAARTGSEHLDLLTHFAEDSALAGDIETFSTGSLFDFLANRRASPVLIISGLEFLIATWAGQSDALEQFASRIEHWNKAPALLFVLQYDQTLATRRFGRHRQHTFVVDQNDTLKL